MKSFVAVWLYLLIGGLCLGAPIWDLEKLAATPQTFAANGLSKGSVKAVFYEGEPWQGKPTRVFGYYGFPEVAAGEKVPAMVLVHGGGGSAFSDWVELWNSRGYAAIAMDTGGAISGGGYNNHKRHEFAGPKGWGGFEQLALAEKDQWGYHAVAAVVRAHSLLRSFPQVDPNRIGITGISWGGYLTSIVAGVDKRFKFAAPVYGCGFIHENSIWLPRFEQMGKDAAANWQRLWEPSVYLPKADLPMLWVTGTNDFAYPLDSLQKSYSASPGKDWLSIPGDMNHGQPSGQEPEVIHAFADWQLKGGEALPEITSSDFSAGELKVEFNSVLPIKSAELNYTTDEGKWQERKWKAIPAKLHSEGKATAAVPEDATVFYINLLDARGFVISSPHQVAK